MTATVQDERNPLEFFELFFDDEVIALIVQETNRYASQFLAKYRTTNGSHAAAWKLLTAQELKVFLALILLQGIIDKPELAMYWSTRRIFQTPIFGELMSKNRFHLIMKFLHFSDNEDEIDESQHPQPKLCKLWPLLCLLKERFLTLYVPESTVAVDESLMLYKGRLSWKQYLPLKRSRFGVKFFLLCESGYISNLIVYTGKGTVTPDADSAMGTKVVLSLMEPFLCKGYCVTVENYYTSPELVNKLLQQKTDVYGTVRPTRKDVPPFKDLKLKRGEVGAFQRGKCMALQWRNKKLVTLLSTVHDATVVEGVNARNEKVVKPAAVYDYNNTMGGVDKSDQNLSYYPAVRDGQKVYYKKIFRHLFDMCVYDSFVLYKKQGGALSQLDYRLDLVEKVIAANHDESQRKKVGRKSDNEATRLTARHFVSFIPPTENKQLPTRRCVVCCKASSTGGTKIRKETRYWCKDCNVAVCVIPCFEIYHTRTNL
ncbi:piggyBac transposable element-derived protein 4 [Ixodes scapularis]|uniref:piggyBac transposable element-derived protein 4 n=1 Tax=Ixodes scapularis TaxID=6945 RepID=UPI001A9EBEFC|nr:piggyBac transposable element-derived protein 4 [Ixodes scapularis]